MEIILLILFITSILSTAWSFAKLLKNQVAIYLVFFVASFFSLILIVNAIYLYFD